MGVAQAGLVFKTKVPLRDAGALVSKLCGGQAVKIEPSLRSSFDIRNHSDVLVQVFGNVIVINNNQIAWDMLEDPASDVTQRHRVLGAPEMLLAFCHYDSGDSYGYAFIERGERTRSRLQTGVPAVVEFGTPKDFESRWLSAPFYLEDDDCPIDQRRKIYFQGEREVEVPEAEITRRLLEEALRMNFGICPWDEDIDPVSHFFRLTAEKNPWWRLW
ncbi:hypothetical protein [Pseudomonas sp. NA-150]|uniref:hypothetical protein n=1 Tax=Pseudomonas sp. NA-150 TaxID=3367525 RepID=UPI0037C69C17